jgi:uncharacterized integral membrane protein
VAEAFEAVSVRATPVADEFEQVARAALGLSFEAARFAAGRDAPRVRRALQDVMGFAILGLVLIAVFVLANTAAVEALTGSLPAWRAPLVLAGVWLGIGVVVATTVLPGRFSLIASSRRTRAGGVVADRSSVEEAEHALRVAIEHLSAAVAFAAEQRVAAAILPIVGQFTQTGEEVVDAADAMIEAADEVTDVIEERLPGGVVINRAFDIALVPGRFGIRAAKSVLNLSSMKPPSASR